MLPGVPETFLMWGCGLGWWCLGVEGCPVGGGVVVWLRAVFFVSRKLFWKSIIPGAHAYYTLIAATEHTPLVLRMNGGLSRGRQQHGEFSQLHLNFWWGAWAKPKPNIWIFLMKSHLYVIKFRETIPSQKVIDIERSTDWWDIVLWEFCDGFGLKRKPSTLPKTQKTCEGSLVVLTVNKMMVVVVVIGTRGHDLHSTITTIVMKFESVICNEPLC